MSVHPHLWPGRASVRLQGLTLSLMVFLLFCLENSNSKMVDVKVGRAWRVVCALLLTLNLDDTCISYLLIVSVMGKQREMD